MKLFLLVLSTAGLWLTGHLINTVSPEQKRNPASAEANEVYEHEASASLVGEFRSSVAGYLWAKTDEYLHGGVLLRAMTNKEKSGIARSATSGDEVQRHEGETSVIPEAERDPRGVWGDLERNIKPFYDVSGHKHRNVRETLPLFRFMTWADPRFIQGYITGSYVLYASDHGRVQEVIAYLREGIAHNPRSPELCTECARYLFAHAGRPLEAEELLLRSIHLHSNREDRDGGEDALNAYRWLVLLYRETGRLELAGRWARRGLQKFPNDPVFERTLFHRGR